MPVVAVAACQSDRGTKLGQLQSTGDPLRPRGGVRVVLRDVNGDGRLDIITGAGPGSTPWVKVVDSAKMGQRQGQMISDSALLDSFFAYEQEFTGGIFVG